MDCLTPKLKPLVSGEIVRCLNELVKDPAFEFTVRDISIRECPRSSSSSHCETLILTIETNNRALLQGQFVYFNQNSMRGFHNNYLSAKIENLIERETGEIPTHLDIHFEVIPVKHSVDYVYKMINYETALRIGILSHESELARAMTKYKLDTLLVAGCEICGPIYGMIKAIEDVTGVEPVDRCLDLFSGTGSLAKVALDNGASFVECVDRDTNESIDRLLSNYRNKYLFIDKDVFEFEPERYYDLLILDPFYDAALDVAQTLLPKIKDFVKLAVFDVGLEIEQYWTSAVQKSIQRICPDVSYRRICENIIAIMKFR